MDLLVRVDGQFRFHYLHAAARLTFAGSCAPAPNKKIPWLWAKGRVEVDGKCGLGNADYGVPGYEVQVPVVPVRSVQIISRHTTALPPGQQPGQRRHQSLEPAPVRCSRCERNSRETPAKPLG